MSANFTLTLDTTAPGGAALAINGGALYAVGQVVAAQPSTTDGTQTGYQMKIWGDVDNTYDANVQTTEAASSWIALNGNYNVKLAAGDGAKNLHCKIRDDVYNTTSQLDASITLDTTLPVITIQSGPDVSKISKQAGKRTATITWQADSHIQAYKVKVVPASNSLENAGTTIGTTNGSTHMTGGATNATTNVTSTIDGADLEAASAGDGDKIIKVFGQDDAGNWSI